MRNINLFSVKYLVEGDPIPYFASGSAPCAKIDFINGVFSESFVMRTAEIYVTDEMERNNQQGKFEILGIEFPEDVGCVFGQVDGLDK